MNRGARWAVPHWFLFGFLQAGSLWLVWRSGAEFSWAWLLYGLVWACGGIILFEIREDQALFQEHRKTAWDILVKIGAVLLVALTAKWWWEA